MMYRNASSENRARDHRSGAGDKSALELLENAAWALEEGDAAAARRLLESFPKLNPRESAADLKLGLFLEAITKKAGGVSGRGNLYLVDFQSQQIDLFDLMANRMPLVSAAGAIANRLLLQMMKGRERVTLVDVGIGSGQQEARLLHVLKQSPGALRELTIVGIEPAPESLKRAESQILAAARGSELTVRFIPMAGCVERFEEKDWELLRACGENFLINEAFALHHVSGPGMKDAVIKRLRELNPIGFVLSEPCSDHENPSLRARFRNAWKHFGLVFDVIDRLDLQAHEKRAMKVFFFAREIEDILAGDEDKRAERHETAEMWLARLKSAGFHPIVPEVPFSDLASEVVQPRFNGEYVSLDFRREPVVAMIAVR